MGRRAGPGGTLRKTWGTEEELQELKKLLRKYFRTMDNLVGKFLLINDGKVVSVFDTYQGAIDEGAIRYGGGRTGIYGRRRRLRSKKDTWYVHEAVSS